MRRARSGSSGVETFEWTSRAARPWTSCDAACFGCGTKIEASVVDPSELHARLERSIEEDVRVVVVPVPHHEGLRLPVFVEVAGLEEGKAGAEVARRAGGDT